MIRGEPHFPIWPKPCPTVQSPETPGRPEIGSGRECHLYGTAEGNWRAPASSQVPSWACYEGGLDYPNAGCRSRGVLAAAKMAVRLPLGKPKTGFEKFVRIPQHRYGHGDAAQFGSL